MLAHVDMRIASTLNAYRDPANPKRVYGRVPACVDRKEIMTAKQVVTAPDNHRRTMAVPALAVAFVMGPRMKVDPRGNPLMLETSFDASVLYPVAAIMNAASQRHGIYSAPHQWQLIAAEDVLPRHREKFNLYKFFLFEYIPEVALLVQRGKHDGVNALYPNPFLQPRHASWMTHRHLTAIAPPDPALSTTLVLPGEE